jgi:predicted GNAT superfamily acetyltransferase
MIEIRSCHGFDELEACVQLQIETWGYDRTDIIPRKAFLVGQKIGGQVIGAFETGSEKPGERGDDGTSSQGEVGGKSCGKAGEKLVGFAMSLPGVKSGGESGGNPRPYLHSHMLAVREGYRNRGLGAQLKLEQRREALERGIDLMEWTFDPLEIRNAHLNIHKLGAIVRCYLVNFYGVSSSRLQGGLPTDRLVAEWNLRSPRVSAIVEDRPRDTETIEERILVPAQIYEWKASEEERDRAAEVQRENRHRFQQAFQRGLAVLGFSRDVDGNGVFELGPSEAS